MIAAQCSRKKSDYTECREQSLKPSHPSQSVQQHSYTNTIARPYRHHGILNRPF
ncbi:hypothetical protein BFJ63_vAg13364 [Fusarium oxysporum f. sp. narcissi]|uniref:Uncharacterized protein n=3 Tax=Fusarium oxysporum TaxID=5507 RepID=A0A420TDC6_FUSOX|nr:hypothetical protein FOMA001_g15256 [Fusarium oxysporum f. sp. matthiolae]RKK09544.1 hypothetical protein BFJ65_g15995 [Fusarium oxysporum f. sp. cepae]RKK95165.1 hypothetical protein BFJ68_g14891 [Fusarium oxysporum]RYC83794.1 hypothetical protein BFJ63_vAg13364 [Fusarium oxysporum f. sp. narcissi]RKK30336.1 hypothetical protein BFJ67_g15803 [Fusarium oxysporum f. sp. cepae]